MEFTGNLVASQLLRSGTAFYLYLFHQPHLCVCRCVYSFVEVRGQLGCCSSVSVNLDFETESLIKPETC